MHDPITTVRHNVESGGHTFGKTKEMFGLMLHSCMPMSLRRVSLHHFKAATELMKLLRRRLVEYRRRMPLGATHTQICISPSWESEYNLIYHPAVFTTFQILCTHAGGISIPSGRTLIGGVRWKTSLPQFKYGDNMVEKN